MMSCFMPLSVLKVEKQQPGQKLFLLSELPLRRFNQSGLKQEGLVSLMGIDVHSPHVGHTCSMWSSGPLRGYARSQSSMYSKTPGSETDLEEVCMGKILNSKLTPMWFICKCECECVCEWVTVASIAKLFEWSLGAESSVWCSPFNMEPAYVVTHEIKTVNVANCKWSL